jgi:arabinofuranosyltransferase
MKPKPHHKKILPPPPASRAAISPLSFFIIAATVIVGTALAFRMRWVCDDIFITLRYVDNFLAGHGIVYNIGERVEGYTHFLWFCLIALGQWFDLPALGLVQGMGLLCFAALLVLYGIIALKNSAPGAIVVPLTALALALHFDVRVWATSGLETSLLTLLVSLSVFFLFFTKLKPTVKHILTGGVLTLALMTRPDAILFYAVAALFVLVQTLLERKSFRDLFLTNLDFHIAFIILYLPYTAWKWAYYGDIFPNTYYAKSGNLSYYSQGFKYLYVFFRPYLSSFVFLLAFPALIVAARRQKSGSFIARLRVWFVEPHSAALLLSLTYVFVYVFLFIARVGGDFMYARFLHPIIPLMYLMGELALRRFLAAKKLWLLIACLALPLLVAFEKIPRDALFINPNGTRKPAFGLYAITDEYWYWAHREGPANLNPIEQNQLVGDQLQTFFAGYHVSVLLRGQASLCYYAKFSEGIECNGLTDSYIAHLPLAKRTRPGHEKSPSLEYLEQRRAHFVFMRSAYDTAAYRQCYFQLGGGYARAEMLTYDRALMNHLRTTFGNAVRFTDFEAYLDDYLAALNTKSKGEVQRDYGKFKGYYFLNESDPAREQRFLSYLNS